MAGDTPGIIPGANHSIDVVNVQQDQAIVFSTKSLEDSEISKKQSDEQIDVLKSFNAAGELQEKKIQYRLRDYKISTFKKYFGSLIDATDERRSKEKRETLHRKRIPTLVNDGNDEDCDADNRTAAGDHGAKPVCGDPLSDAVISDQHLPHLKGPQMTRNGSIEGGSFYDHGRSAEKVPEQKTQNRKESLVGFLPLECGAGTYTGEQSLTGNRRCTGEGTITGDCMRNDTYSADRGCPVEHQSQPRKNSPEIFLPVQEEDNMFTGDQAVAGDKRNTGAGALSGNRMRDDESEMVGDNHVGSLGDSLFGSQS
ncbi:hypothetical protein L2E82_51420 [Cichorium intybus]|nr:hypothetical protein L2E82_51420 [Cichorium intybus]